MSDFIERAKFSCALGGAIVTLTSLPRTVPIVHASGGCASMLSGTFNFAGGYRGSGYCGGNMIPTSNISERNVVFGGEDRLDEQIDSTLRIIDADLYFVVTGCQVEIIGDDAVGISRKYRDRDVLGLSTPGFAGNSFKGYDIVINTVVSDLVEPSEKKEPKTINILGVVPGQDVFIRGNLREIKRLLGLIGVQANTFFGDGESIAKIKKYSNASLTVVFSDSYGIQAAKTFEELHGIPWITTDLPVGPGAAEDFLRTVSERLDISPIIAQRAIEEEKRTYYGYIERILDSYMDLDFQRYAIVSADSSYAYPFTRYLAEDLGWIPHLTVINDLTEEADREAYRRKFDSLTSETKPGVIFEPHSGQLLSRIRDSWEKSHNDPYYNSLSPAFLVGSSIDAGVAEKLGAGFLPAVFPITNRVVLNKTYAGFTGGLTLAEDLLSALVSNR